MAKKRKECSKVCVQTVDGTFRLTQMYIFLFILGEMVRVLLNKNERSIPLTPHNTAIIILENFAMLLNFPFSSCACVRVFPEREHWVDVNFDQVMLKHAWKIN